MRRPNREIQIFNLSSLDLFASAMGSFLILTTILMPYYKRAQQLSIEEARLRDKITSDEEAVESGRALKELRDQIEAAENAREEEAQIKGELKPLRDSGDEYFRVGSIPIAGSRIALLIDGPAAAGSRGKRVKSQAEFLLRIMRPEHSLKIVTYYHSPSGPKLDRWPSEERYEAMSPEARARALDYVRALPSSTSDGTPHLAALLHVLEAGDAENVVVVSDGLGHPRYNDGLEPLAVIDKISAANSRRVRIHAVLIVDTEPTIGSIVFFQELSTRNGGQFQIVK